MYLPESDALVLYIPHERPTNDELADFQRNVLYFTEKSKSQKIAINLYKLKKIDINGIKILLELKKALENRDISLVYYNLNSQLVKYLPSSRLAKCIKVANF